MGRDQIYSSQPSDELFQKIIEAFGLTEIDTEQSFTRNNLRNNDTLAKLTNLIPYLKKCYLPCKARTYLNDLTYKNIITVFRHTLKTRGFTVLSREKYSKGTKYIHYRIINYKIKNAMPKIKINTEDNKVDKTSLIVTFN